MASIEFSNESRSRLQTEEVKGITGLVIRMGLAKDTASANVVMIITTIVCFAVSFYLMVLR